MKIKITQRLTYPEARKIYDQQKQEFNFSKVVPSMPKKPETKTSSTQYNVKDSEITKLKSNHLTNTQTETKQSKFNK